MRQIPLAIAPVAVPCFDNFLPGPNKAPWQHLMELMPTAGDDSGSARPHPVPPPVYLWGPAGSGKTHLLQAAAHRLHAQGQALAWFDAGQAQPWAWSEQWRWVFIDRCEALDMAAQRSAFALFVEAAANGAQVMAAGRLPPVDLPLREELRSRLAWGPVFGMSLLGDADARTVLRREAEHRGMALPDEVLTYLLSRCARDLAHLMRLLNALDDFALVRSRHVTVPLVRALLAEEGLVETVGP